MQCMLAICAICTVISYRVDAVVDVYSRNNIALCGRGKSSGTT